MESPYKGKTGFKRICNAILYSFDGFAAAFRHEDAFRQEVFLASVLLVMVVELLNSGIEAVTDRVSLEDHSLAKRAKDLGSAAVMLSLINVPAVWLLVIFG